MSSTVSPGRAPPAMLDESVLSDIGNLSAFSPRTTVPGVRLPREGPSPGGGRVRVLDRQVFEKTVQADAENDDGNRPAGLKKLRLRRNSNAKSIGASGSESARTRSGGKMRRTASHSNFTDRASTAPGGSASSGDGPESSRCGDFDIAKDDKFLRPGRLSQKERKRAEIFAKWQKFDQQRQNDQQEIQERVEKLKGMRDDRFKRVLNEVTGRGNLAFQTAMAIREYDAHEERRLRDQYNTWDEKVFQPMATQIFEHLNPEDRELKQAVLGTKSVAFTLPDKKFKVRVKDCDDPAKQQIMTWAYEANLDRELTSVFTRSRSAPEFTGPLAMRRAAGTACSVGKNAAKSWPTATSRPTLEPMLYDPVPLRGLPYGKFAQDAEYGPGFKRSMRGGYGVHLHDESDGVPAFGKHTVRDPINPVAVIHNNCGVLVGDIAMQGESQAFKTPHGTSSIAPNQDHYNYETGVCVTAMEFPLGKKMFPQFH
eukprot:gnl/TRDRNA2_/TRDRNA2_191395_c0_seq1.p1 gnl/TRDRNA2_/TRDRNA2_191395_c0~~gnl/TRDRNA2_/TRDRNA2_191395_c0_seq1.p1  ORF type:complete len:498 (-),score=79.28 gnl/TRDRNA2_/TRDRNA2_191395_c0_seq1:59-1504(-)